MRHSPIQSESPKSQPSAAEAPPYLPAELSRVIKRLEKIEWALDRAFTIPGTSIRFGWDSVVGLVPGIGDLASFVPLGYYFSVARRYKLGKRMYLRLGFNQGIDFLIGTVPLIGDVFDVGFKANTRNAALLVAALKSQYADRAKRGLLASDE